MTTDFRALCGEILQLLDYYIPEDGRPTCWDTWRQRARTALAEHESGIPKNCWLDARPDLYPSRCVFDDPSDHVCNCMFATQLETDSKPKTDCKYYRQ